MKHKFFILYSNNQVESVSKLNDTLIRQIETGVIAFAYDIENNTVKGKTDKGLQDIQVPFIK